MSKSKLYYAIFSLWLLFLVFLTSATYQLPNNSFTLHYFNDNSRIPTAFTAYTDEDNNITLGVWIHLIIDLEEELVTITVRLDYFEGPFNNVTRLPYFIDDALVKFDDQLMSMSTRSQTHPNSSRLKLSFGTLDRINFETNYDKPQLSERSTISVGISVGLFDYHNVSQKSSSRTNWRDQ